MDGVFRLWTALTNVEDASEAADVVSVLTPRIRNTYYAACLHVCTLLSMDALACPPAIVRKAVQHLLCGISLPNLAGLRSSRLVREKGVQTLRALVEAHHSGKRGNKWVVVACHL